MYILVKTCTEYLNREWCIIEWVRSVISNECWIMNFIYAVVVFPFGWVLLVKQPIPMSEYSSQYGSCVSKLVIPGSPVSYCVLVCVVESCFVSFLEDRQSQSWHACCLMGRLCAILSVKMMLFFRLVDFARLQFIPSSASPQIVTKWSQFSCTEILACI